MTIYSLDILLFLFGTSSMFSSMDSSMSSSNCCFMTCIQVSQEAGQVVWYAHLFLVLIYRHCFNFFPSSTIVYITRKKMSMSKLGISFKTFFISLHWIYLLYFDVYFSQSLFWKEYTSVIWFLNLGREYVSLRVLILFLSLLYFIYNLVSLYFKKEWSIIILPSHIQWSMENRKKKTW